MEELAFYLLIHLNHRSDVACNSAEEAIRKFGEITEEDVDYVNLNLSSGDAGAKEGYAFSQWKKLRESGTVQEFGKYFDMKLSYWYTFGGEIMKDLNKFIKEGIKFKSLSIECKRPGSLETVLVEGIETKHKEVLPPLSLPIRSQRGVEVLKHCLKVGWPIIRIELFFNDGNRERYNWEMLKSLFKGAKFKISVNNRTDRAFKYDVFPVIETVSGAANEHTSLRGFVGDGIGRLLCARLEPALGAWKNIAKTQIRSVQITEVGRDSLEIRGDRLVVAVASRNVNEVLKFLSTMYSSGEERFLRIEKLDIKLEFQTNFLLAKNQQLALSYEETKMVQQLMSSITTQDHALVSFKALYDYRYPLELPEKLEGQIEANLSKKMSHWMESGAQVLYDRIKLMMIGQARAGKTSTIRSLLRQPIKKDVQSTLVAEAGLDISMNVRDISSTVWMENNRETNWVVDEMAEYLAKLESKVRHNMLPTLPTPKKEQMKVELVKNEASNNPMAKPSLDKEAVAQNLKGKFREIRSKSHKENLTKHAHLRLTIWDFGGQEIFYALHHLYLSSGGVFILVFDLRLMKNHMEEELRVMNFWLDSVSLHAPASALAIVGTRIGSLPSEKMKEVDLKVRSLLENKRVEHLEGNRYSFFPVNNVSQTYLERQIQPLRKAIRDYVKTKAQQPEAQVSQMIPFIWIYFMNHLVNKFKHGITTNKLFEVGKAMNLDRERDIMPMLEFYKNAGAIIPFMKASTNNDKVISDYIVLSPEWLLKALGTFVYDPELHKRKASLYKDSYMRALIANYERSGVLSKKLLMFIFGQAEIKPKDYGFLLQLCQEMLIMSRFDYKPEWATIEDDSFFLVPTMNKEVSDEEVILGDAPVEDCVNIYLHFERAVPIGLFERVICVLLTCNQDFDGTTLKPVITRNFAVFCFRETEVFLVDEHENGDFRLALRKGDDSDLNSIGNLLEIGSVVLQKLKSDVLGKHIPSSIIVRSLDSKGKHFSYSVEDLLNAVSKNKPKVRTIPAKGRERLRRISELELFGEAAELIVKRQKQEQEQKKLKWVYDVFLAHTWGPNNETHDQVVKIDQLLKERNFRTWLDEANLKRFVANDIVDGLKKSSCILVFITELYLEKVENADTNASKEFAQAVKKGTDFLVPVVLDPKCLDPKSWLGSKVGYQLTDALYIDFSSEEKIKTNIGKLCERIEEMSQAPRP